ncbi:phage integrase N-terminal SAM-like domain-containing protein [Thauera aromatica]|uniref:phage integrase N-terminal SAM-like domain-containing protein n=1 Tax=Thauera aromatica TaxID=59405 RepID=UPI003CD0D495
MTADPSAPASPRLLDRVRERIRVKHYSIRTEQVYVDWIRRFILFHGKRHPQELGAPEVEAFLTHLAVAGRVAASTQNQAKSALLFLYREVLAAVELPWLDGVPLGQDSCRLDRI